MANVFPIIFSARSSSFLPRSIEKRGAPPVPNKFAKAVTMEMMGNVSPIPVRALAAASGICQCTYGQSHYIKH